MWWLALALASSPAHSEAAYWRVRDRLSSEYMVPGDQPGEMTPTSRRVDLTASMKWSDATIQLGWLIGALALEQALLADPSVLPDYGEQGRTADDAAADLALALATLDRLDDHDASAFPDCAGPWGLDGFFVRDDVPATINTEFDGIDTIESDWIDPVGTNKEMSQDQVIHLLVGLALVARWTDPVLTVDGVNLRDQAVAATTRIASLVAADGDWVIRNPGCDNREVNRGESAQFYSTAMADSFVAITGETPAEGLYPDAWEDSAVPDYVGWSNQNNLHMAMALAAVGDAWGETTYDDLLTLAAVHDWTVYPALHAALWGPPSDAKASALDAALLAQLGELGDGAPSSPWPYGPSPNGWTTWHRYITEGAYTYVGEDDSSGFAFPGTDYLLASNLHTVLFEADWPAADADTGGGPCGCSAAGTSLGPGAAVALLLLLCTRRARRSPPLTGRGSLASERRFGIGGRRSDRGATTVATSCGSSTTGGVDRQVRRNPWGPELSRRGR
jgi:hypothetical protein